MNKKSIKLGIHKTHKEYTGLLTIKNGEVLSVYYTTKNKLIDSNGELVSKKKVCNIKATNGSELIPSYKGKGITK